MNKPPRRHAALGRLILMGLFLCSCASTSYIGIDYSLPPAKGSMTGRTVRIRVIDQRSVADTLSASAREDFEHFTGLFSLSVGESGQRPILIGAYDVAKLFQTTFARRFADLGATVVTGDDPQAIPVKIILKEFLLQREGLQYKASLNYEASLSHPSGKSVSKSVSGNAERIKLTGKRDMEKLLGDIFTDLVNRLDIPGLFAEAGY